MPIPTFDQPLFLVLLLLLPWVWRHLTSRSWHPATILRILVFILFALVLAQPRIQRPDAGVDFILLVDRSASCADDADRAARELQTLLPRSAGGRDRVALVGFARSAAVERRFDPAAPDAHAAANAPTAVDGSELAAALRYAAALRDPARRTVVLAVSDGRHTGPDPLAPETLAALEGLPVWFRNLDHGQAPDVAALEIVLPEGVEPRSAWRVRYTIFSGTAQTADYLLSRGDLVLAQGTVSLEKGPNHFFVRDTAADAGLLEYRLEVFAPDDPIPENNIARAVLPVQGEPRALLVTSRPDDGGLLASALSAAGIHLDIRAPGDLPEDPARYLPHRLVILENSRLVDMPSDGVRALATAVEAGVTALWVTGGGNGFGLGGYHRSRLDPLLPVELELRNDRRRGVMALALALDRSGSMAVPAGPDDPRPKMELANLAAAESLRLLSPLDEVAVFAVDTEAHLVVPLSRAEPVDPLIAVVMRVESAGGGIYVRTAMEAGVAQLEKSGLPTRHLVIFADAADAEEQEDCLDLAESLVARGFGLSIIALGERTDADGEFLEALARAGGGEALFTRNVADLPSLFSQEVIRASQRGFLRETTPLRARAPLAGLDISPDAPLPEIDGHNIAAPRDGATVFLDLEDEFDTPLWILRTRGRATTAATLFEIDGEFSGAFARWSRAPDLLAATARRLMGDAAGPDLRAYADLRHGLALIRLELSEAEALRRRGQTPVVQLLGPDGAVLGGTMRWTGPREAEWTTPLHGPGHHLPVVGWAENDDRLTARPLTVPYSAEFTPREDFAGARLLARLGELTGGGEALNPDEIRRSATRLTGNALPLRQPLLILMIVLYLIEFIGRRFALFP